MAELGETLHGLEADGRQTESSPGAGRVSKCHPHKPESEFVNPKTTAIPSSSRGILLESRPKPRGQFVSGVFGVCFSAAGAIDGRSQTVLKGVASSQTGPSTGVMPKAVIEGVDLGIDTAAGRFSGSVAPSCGGGDNKRNKVYGCDVPDHRPPPATGQRCTDAGCKVVGNETGALATGEGDKSLAWKRARIEGVWMGFAWYPDSRQNLTWPVWLASRSGVPWPGQLRSEKGERKGQGDLQLHPALANVQSQLWP
ncbi:hypothetical protein CDEST_09988 [Colletotrichum destructivum]|uniref:Uncharacterized protein n=1 Tax=Colletotrichum destructivum TaxID=34406 RepID=A0AAX4INK1_9PEZI|nr:hypothetical protein CDEST_09988 [Colletotrichum destructivum]